MEIIKKYIKESIKELKPEEKITAPKARLYQMYFVVGKLENPKFLNLDFIINFGVLIETKNSMKELIEENAQYKNFKKVLMDISLFEVLILYKYFSYAHKKISHIFYKENKDDIKEDLLEDFIESDEEGGET
jgi:hypothetical protein